jgi:hypothetical protein
VPHKTGIRLIGVAQNPANGFPARLLGANQMVSGLFINYKTGLFTGLGPHL